MNENIFRGKYHKYKQMIFNICYSYLKTHDDAEDVMQDTFISFYHLNKSFINDDQEKYYLIRMTINNCKNMIKKNKHIYHFKDDEVNNLKSLNVIEKTNIIDIISFLDNKLKEVIVLKYAENLSNREIASALNISEENVRKRLERAIKTLKNKWEVNKWLSNKNY